jgi:GT2 family glycosyltransferase
VSGEPESGSSPVGVVVIGRNEGERLRVCLGSVCDGARPVVYVDSGSTDGSVALARSFGAEVVDLDMSLTFSAGRARNEGARRLLEFAPDVVYVQFVDGDCELVPTWFDAATAALRAEPDLAVVCGRRRERYPERSPYNALCDIEWDTPVGEADACGGDAMMRVSAFQAVGGFNPSIVAGEEPELCIRLRQHGYRIFRLPEEMTIHDAAMARFSQWWKRTKRSGHAHAEIAYLHGRSSGHPGVRQTFSNVLWSTGVPLATTLAFRFSPASGLVLAAYPVQALRILRRESARGRTNRQAALYALSCVVGKWPETLGAMRFWAGVITGKTSGIIEYKDGGAEP